MRLHFLKERHRLIPALRLKGSRRAILTAVTVLLMGGLGLAAVLWKNRYSTPLPAGISKDEYARTVRNFRVSQRREPEAADILFRIGMTRADSREWGPAAACFGDIPRKHPRYGQPAAFMRGQVLLQMNRLSE